MKNSYFSKFIFAFILLLVTSSGSLFAQAQEFTVSGVVTEATTGEVLIGANVYFPTLFTGAATNDKGESLYLNHLLADEELGKSLSAEQIRECFNYDYYTKNVDAIFKRVFN